MNIFYVDDDPVVAARQLNDTHVMSTIRECSIMLSAWYANLEHKDKAELANVPWTKLSHQHHPMTLWLQDRLGNAQWAAQHGMAALDEYRRRFKKRDTFIRASELFPAVDAWINRHTVWAFQRRPPMCMPETYMVEGDTILSYRLYYIHEKQQLGKWTPPGKPPEWLNMLEDEERKEAAEKAKKVSPASLKIKPKGLIRGKPYQKPEKKSIAGLKLNGRSNESKT